MKNDIIDYIQSPDLFKFYSRNSSVQIGENFAYYAVRELKRREGIYFSQLSVNRNEFLDVYARADEFARINKKIATRLQRSRTIADFFTRRALPIFEKYHTFTKRMRKKYASQKVHSRDLAHDYLRFAQINAAFIAYNLYIFITDPVLDSVLKEKLGDRLKDIAVITKPLQKPAIVREHNELLKIAALKTNNKEQTLKRHAKKWQWFPCYNPCDDPYTVDHFAQQLAQYSAQSARAELQNQTAQSAAHKKQFQTVLASIADSRVRALCRLANDVCFYREHRTDIRREGLCDIRPLFERIAQALDLTIKEVCYLTRAEVLASLKARRTVMPRSVVQKRLARYAIFNNNNNVFVEDDDTMQKIQNAFAAKRQPANTVEGRTAYPGIIRGQVRVVSHISALVAFQQGEIMVASMTASDYVPAMKKCAAIVTDEGGVTCHAAIVSRELKIPCVVGTQNATQVFRDGDMVEVDATNGIVKKL